SQQSEYVRGRLNGLAEKPQQWDAAVQRWSALNAGKKSQVDKREAPSRNDEFLLYQTLVGAWPAEIRNESELHDSNFKFQISNFRSRIENYMLKAVHEAKVYTSWIAPNAGYDDAIRDFVHKLLPDDPNDLFLKDFIEFQRQI